jgi:hypothetical protein
VKYIFLLLKVHNKTGLKYLCKRITKYEATCYTYKGSGKRWKNHVAFHGYDVSTTILGKFSNSQDFNKAANFYNKLWNVGNSKDFANLIPEQGDGGNTWGGPKTEQRRLKCKERMKQFHASDKGKELQKKLAVLNKELQLGKPMTERMRSKNECWIDPRKGKKFKDIYKSNYTHPQQKPFKIKLENSNKEWICNNERDFQEQLRMCPHPSLTQLKQHGKLHIKHTRQNSKHSFKKGDVLTFQYIIA